MAPVSPVVPTIYARAEAPARTDTATIKGTAMTTPDPGVSCYAVRRGASTAFQDQGPPKDLEKSVKGVLESAGDGGGGSKDIKIDLTRLVVSNASTRYSPT